MNRKSNAVVTIDLKLHYQFDLVRALRWLLPMVVVVLKFSVARLVAGP